jgi:hypothetical protein
MRAALEKEPVLAADETPVNVLTPDTDPQAGGPVPGAAQVMVIRTPDERLVWLQALASRRAEGITALLAFFTGFLIVDGYSAYQQLSGKLAGIQQCCQHYADTVVMPIRGRRRWRAGVPGLAVSA